MTGRLREALRRLALPAVPLAWLLAFFGLPFLVVVKISLSDPATALPPYTPVLDWDAGLAAWADVLAALDFENYRTLIADPLYLEAGLTSLAVALGATGLLVLVGYPIAYAMARAPKAWQPLLVALMVIPFWTSFLIRVYAWIAILKGDGLLNQALLGLGLVRKPVEILNTPAAVMIGMVYAYLPFMVLPLYAVLERLDRGLIEAARDLGASRLAAFRTVTLPLSWPGLVAGALLCFIPITGEFIIPDLLGGPDTLMLGRVLWSEFFSNRDWPLASAVAVALLVIVAGPVVLFREAESRRLERP
ncbi:ABC transporter permease [Methylobacterium platani]|uniref:Spermidine/putrescine ABC transporter permease n=2 Tax=Methylobacterium platani TaxID=427683 RepID=A0A179S1T9_9HYPH|nr:ABC transporter permease subunit [Methylobacterium platani]KMO17929.1 spermidine/putrescine ABC transporter permease [Methylobacterium platani JCM 14648]OAS19608.1 spermidine/putrescine ABC transporter permease [Methylobacterium platani]